MLKNLSSICNQLKSGDCQGLWSLRREVVDLNLIDVFGNYDPYRFVGLFLTKKLVNDIWRNLGTDASFEFPSDLAKNVLISLGMFVENALLKDPDPSEAYGHLRDFVSAFYATMNDIQANPHLVSRGGDEK